MIKKRVYYLLIGLFSISPLWAIEIQVDAAQGHRSISPYIYGKNNCLSDDADDPLADAQWQRLRDAGIRMVRESGGNNSTKYNWALNLSSHPD